MNRIKWRKRFLPCTLAALMAFAYMPASVFALNTDATQGAVLQEDAVQQESAKDTAKTPAQQTSNTQQDAKQNDNAKDTGDAVQQSAAASAPAAQSTEIPISTADDLMQIITATKQSDTLGKTYTLKDDITIDTSDLDVSYSATTAKRIFAGTLDGSGHKITVTANGAKPARPLFDRIDSGTGQSLADMANVKDLTLQFEGDAQGATLASSIKYAALDNIHVNFVNILPDQYGSTQYASGLIGVIPACNAYVHDVHISGKTIGSEKATSGVSTVEAAGLANYTNGVGYVFFDQATIDVDAIAATGSGSGTVCASGAISAYSSGQCQAELQGISVKAKNIKAETTGSADVFANGLAYLCTAMSDCQVDVEEDILAQDNGSSQSNLVLASGLGFDLKTPRNGDSNLTKYGIGIKENIVKNTSVKARTIKAASASGGNLFASGLAYSAGYDALWSGTTVTADSILAEDSGSSTDTNAIAAGFTSSGYVNNKVYSEDGSADGCKVTADLIRGTSKNGCGYAFGFEMYSYAPKKNCSADVKEILAEGKEDTAASGFGYFFSNSRGWPTDASYSAGKVFAAYDGCSVSADRIVAHSTGGDANTAGFLIATWIANSYPQINGTDRFAVTNNQITVKKELKALVDGSKKNECTALFAIENPGQTQLRNNTVYLAEDDTEIITHNGSKYVRFTTSENNGMADNSQEWESDNKVIFENSGYTMTCEFDNSSDKGTLWKIAESDVKVSYDLNGGDPAADASYDDQLIAIGTAITAAKAPARDNYKFLGWSDGKTLYQEGDSITVSGKLTLTAQWEKVKIPGKDDGNSGNNGSNSSSGSDTTSSGTTGTSAKTPTGDSAHPALYALALLLSAAGAAGILLRRRHSIQK